MLRTTELLSFLFTLFIYIYCNRGFRFFYLSIDSSLLVTTLAPLTACPLSHWWDMSPCLWFFTPKDGNFVIWETHERMHEHWPLNPYDKVISDTLHIKILRNSFILVVAVRYLLIFPYNHLVSLWRLSQWGLILLEQCQQIVFRQSMQMLPSIISWSGSRLGL